MFNYIFKLVNVLSRTQQYLCLKLYVQFVIIVNTILALSNIHAHEFLSMRKNI